MRAPTIDEARFLLGELPACKGVAGFGCGSPVTKYIDPLKRHVCDACSEEFRSDDAVDSPIASFIRDTIAAVESDTPARSTRRELGAFADRLAKSCACPPGDIRIERGRVECGACARPIEVRP